MGTKKIMAVILTIIACMFWGLGGVLSQHVMQTFHVLPQELTMLRMSITGGGVLIYLALRKKLPGKEFFENSSIWKRFVTFAIAGLVFNQFSYLKTITLTNPGTATILQYVAPILLLIYYCLVGKRWPKRKEIFAILFTIVGILLITTHGKVGQLVLSKEGLVWGMLSAVGMVFYHMLPLPLIKRYGPLATTGIGMAIGGLCLSLFIHPWNHLDLMNGHFILWLVLTVIVGTLTPYVLYLKGIQYLGPLPVSLIGTVEPVASTLLTVFLLKTSFVLLDYLGMGFILATVLLTVHDK